MDAATLQTKIYSGYAKAAERLGVSTYVFRPLQADAPFTQPIATLKASFTAEEFHYGKPRKYGQAMWYGLFDGSQTQAGDYLVRGASIWFIASQALHLPILCVACQRKIRISRPVSQTAVGALPYQGRVEPKQKVVLGSQAAWPASLLLGAHQEAGLNLPASVKEAGWIALLPPSVPITIQSGDVITDDLKRRFTVYVAELSELGWRLQVKEAHP